MQKRRAMPVSTPEEGCIGQYILLPDGAVRRVKKATLFGQDQRKLA